MRFRPLLLIWLALSPLAIPAAGWAHEAMKQRRHPPRKAHCAPHTMQCARRVLVERM